MLNGSAENMESAVGRQLSRPPPCLIERLTGTLYTSSMNPSVTRHRRSCKYGAWLMTAVLLLSSCSSVSMPTMPSLGPPTEDEEARISREFRREAKKQFRFANNPEVERYVDRIGRRILAATGPLSFDYRFFVIEENQLNAFAVPGGSIYVFTGLLERLKSADELAGVLGHEITHAKGHHMARSSGPDAISILSLLSMALLAKSGSGAQAAGVVGQAVAATRQAAYSRQLELEADTLGARYMSNAGFDPKGSISFLKTLDQERLLNPTDVPAYILSHPITQERVANAELVVKSLGATAPRPEDPVALKKVQLIIRVDRSARDDVVGEYEKLVKQSPNNADLLHLLGFAQQLKGDLASAKINYEKANQLKPDNAGLQRDLGRLYSQTDNFASARAAYDRSIALDANEPLTFLYLGEMLEKSGDLRSAAGAYLNAQNLAPLWDRPPYKLGFVYSKLDRLSDGYYYLARSYRLQDEDEKAIGDYEKALKLVGENTPRGQVIKEELRALKERKK